MSVFVNTSHNNIFIIIRYTIVVGVSVYCVQSVTLDKILGVKFEIPRLPAFPGVL